MKLKMTLPVIIMFSILTQSCSDNKAIAPFTLSGNEKEIMKVDADGKVWVDGKQIAILHSDGLISDTKNDTIAIRKADGTVYDAKNKEIVKISADGSIDYGNEKLSWNPDGTLVFMGDETLKIVPNNKDLYSNASLLFVIYASLGESEGSLPN